MSDDARFRRVVGEEPLDPGDAAAFRRIVELSSALDVDDRRPPAPPESVWAGIAAAVAAEGTDRPGVAVAEMPPPPGPPADAATIRPIGGRPPARSHPWLLSAAAAVIAVVAGVAGYAIGAGDRTDTGTIVAAGELEVLDELAGPARARLLSETDGLVLELDATSLDPAEGFFEVWLITPEVDGLVSLGPVRADGRYVVPPGIDPARFSVVDVSLEPHDGDPTHSGHSVLRGDLA